MIKTLAFKIVFKELIKIPMCVGRYDAKNGGKSFIHGIGSVMEIIANMAGEKEEALFDDMFTKNIIESEEKVKK